MPRPCWYTSVLAVPRSMARSLLATPLRPHHPVRGAGDEAFLLPDRHVLLDPLDAVTGGLERLRAMRRRAADQDGDLSDRQPADAVQQGHLADRPPLEHLVADGSEQPDRP